MARPQCDEQTPLLIVSNNLFSSSNYGPFSFDDVVYISYKVICKLFLKPLYTFLILILIVLVVMTKGK